jgi:hypothetical protein
MCNKVKYPEKGKKMTQEKEEQFSFSLMAKGLLNPKES